MDISDIVEEVLLGLTVEDLLRCKSVCKSWYSLISSPYFIKLHLKHMHMCNKKEEEENNKQLGNRRISLWEEDEWRYHIVGSSNGLVCMSYLDNIFLMNPATRDFEKLQEPPILPAVDELYDYQRYGFGYDSSADDYKFVSAKDQGSKGTIVHILSLKSNVWKLFGHVKYTFHDESPGILFNGAIHWFFYNNADNIKQVILVSFDLAKDQFIEIPQPDDSRYVRRRLHKLGILDDHICIFEPQDNGCPSKIWVMKNYNVKQSWELLPTPFTTKDHVHYMSRDSTHSEEMPKFFCRDYAFPSIRGRHISCPIFVQTLVSPYVKAKKNKMAKETIEFEDEKEDD